jgi:hypothetical protein
MEFQFTPELQRAIAQDSSAFAQDPSTAPEILEELAAPDRLDHIRQLVAGNPNTPEHILLQLIIDFPHEVTENVAFMLSQLENPAFLLEIEVDDLIEIFRRGGAPQILVNHAIHHRGSGARQILVKNYQLTETELQHLMMRDQYSIEAATKIICHPNFSESQREEIAMNGHEKLHIALADYCLEFTQELPIALIKMLIDNASTDIHLQIALSPRITSEILDYLFTLHGSSLRESLILEFRGNLRELPALLQPYFKQNQ